MRQEYEKTADRKHLDPDLFLHPLDKAAMKALQAIPGFTQLMKAFMKIWNEQQFKIINMSTNLKLSEQQMKKYYDMLPPICERLGIEIPEIYVTLDIEPNAYTYGDTNPFIVLTSGLFETLPDELIPSVLAHECGHIACHHALYTTMGNMVLNGLDAFTTGLANIAVYPIQLAFAYWMRCSEFSADRAAMICDGHSRHVFETMMRFAGYDKDIMADVSREAFMEQAKEYRNMVDGNGWNKTLEFIMFKNYSHPLNAVRALEVYEWEQSERFRSIMAQYTDAGMEMDLLSVRPKEIHMQDDEKAFIGKHYKYAVNVLEYMGFTNVEAQGIAIPKLGIFAKPDMVAKIMVDGLEGFEKDSWYLQDVSIIIYYYAKEEEQT